MPKDKTPPELADNPKFCPFFKDCLGAVDGCHFHAWVFAEMMLSCRNRKGWISQNVFAACKFNAQFCYILSGWEGSAADGRVFEDARRRDFAIPPGKYYLADAGFLNCDALLVPYRGVHYHLKEWEQSSLR